MILYIQAILCPTTNTIFSWLITFECDISAVKNSYVTQTSRHYHPEFVGLCCFPPFFFRHCQYYSRLETAEFESFDDWTLFMWLQEKMSSPGSINKFHPDMHQSLSALMLEHVHANDAEQRESAKERHFPRTLSTSVLRIKHRSSFWERFFENHRRLAWVSSSTHLSLCAIFISSWYPPTFHQHRPQKEKSRFAVRPRHFPKSNPEEKKEEEETAADELNCYCWFLQD